MQLQEIGELPINPRIVAQMAKATVRSLIDAAVELITNSDDSYRRLHSKGLMATGRIDLFISREKGGACRDFWVRDYAEGMKRAELKKAIEFGGETSGFETGQTVRGLFGRGLKEAIISLGEAEIYTIRDNVLNSAKVWWDENQRKPLYGLTDEISELSPEMRKDIGIEQGNGTLVKIRVKNEKIKVPELDNLKQQLSKHFALRGINSSVDRQVLLTFQDLKRNLTRSNVQISFQPPQGELVYAGQIKVPKYGDNLVVRIFRCQTPLQSPYLNPCGTAGLMIKSEAAILDNRLFKFEGDPAACYFWGEVHCDALAKRIREGDTGVIDPNRGGIEWRHEYCQLIQHEIEGILEPLIQAKRKELEKLEDRREMPDATRKALRRLRDLLNDLAKKEFEEWEPPAEPAGKIEKVTILPAYANIEVDKPRTLSVYAPNALVKLVGNKAQLRTNNFDIQTLSSHITLDIHPKYRDLYYGYFKVVGRADRAEGEVYCKLGEEWGKARLKVAPQKKWHKGKEPAGRKGGFISDILPDPTPEPIQRVEYVRHTGEIKIYVQFPGVARYIGPGLEGSDTDRGKVMLAELVGEAFCRALATRALEEGRRFKIPGAEVEAFTSTVNEFQRKYLDSIHKILAG